MLYEYRRYEVVPGKMPALNRRFSALRGSADRLLRTPSRGT